MDCEKSSPVLCMAWPETDTVDCSNTATALGHVAPDPFEEESNCTLTSQYGTDQGWALDNMMNPDKIADRAKSLGKLRKSYKYDCRGTFNQN